MPNKRGESPSEVATTWASQAMYAIMHNATYNHASDTKKAAAYEPSHVAYPTFQNIRPTELRDETRSYVPKCDDTFRGGRRHEVESGRKNDNI